MVKGLELNFSYGLFIINLALLSGETCNSFHLTAYFPWNPKVNLENNLSLKQRKMKIFLMKGLGALK